MHKHTTVKAARQLTCVCKPMNKQVVSCLYDAQLFCHVPTQVITGKSSRYVFFLYLCVETFNLHEQRYVCWPPMVSSSHSM